MAGSDPRPAPTREQWTIAVATLASYLVHAEESQGGPMFGGRTALETLEALSAITRLPMDWLVEIAHSGERP